MGAYQPIELPQGMGLGGADRLHESMQGLVNFNEQQKRQAQELAQQKLINDRQKSADAQARLQAAMPHIQRGDFGTAKAILGEYASDFNIQDPNAEREQLSQKLGIGQPGAAMPGQGLPAQLPGTPPQSSPLQPPAQGGSAVPDQLDNGRKLAAEPQQSDPEAEFSAQPPPPPQANGADLEALMQRAAPLAPQAPEAGPAPSAPTQLNPLQSGYQKDRDRQANLSKRLVSFMMGGQRVEIDPDAERNYAMRTAAEDRQRQAGMIGGALGDQKYDQMLTKLTAVYGPEMASKMVVPLMEKDAAARERAQAASDKQEHSDKMWGQTQDRIDARSEANQKALMNRAVVVSQPGLKTDTGNRQNMGQIDKEFGDWRKTAGWDKQIQNYRQVQAAGSNILSGNAIGEKDAALAMARYFRGGMPTESEMHFVYGDLAGRLGDSFPRFYETMMRGGLDEAQKKVLQGSIATAQREMGHITEQMKKSARIRFGNGVYDNYRPWVNDQLNSAFAELGQEPIDFFAENKTPSPGPALGAGNPAVRAPKAPAAKPESGHAAVDDFLKSIGH